MNSLWLWGAGMVRQAQSLGPSWLLPAHLVTSLGTGGFLLLLVTFVYWCLDASAGLHLAFLLVCVDGPTALLKLTFHMPRPYWYDSAVRALSIENSYGLPSGHATASTAVGLFFAQRAHRWWAWLLAGILVLLISCSRIYLGVHFPTDVVAGWMLGALIWLAFNRIMDRAGRWIQQASWISHLLLAVVGSGLLLALTWGVLQAIASHPDPPEWAITASRNAGPPLTPRSPDDLVASAGLLLGVGIGATLSHRRARFDAGGTLMTRLLRYALGFSGIVACQAGLAGLQAALPLWNGLALQYLRAACTGFWAVFLAPLIFLRLGLAKQGA